MAVGRHQAHRVRPQDEQRAVEEVARVFAGDRKLRLRDHLLQHVARQRRAVGAGAVRQRRKVLARQRLHARVEPIGRDLDAALVFLDPDVGLGQRLDDLVELLRRQRQRSASSTTDAVTRAAQPDLEIGREQLHLARRRLRSARSRGSESCSCARRCPGRVAVRAADRSCGRPVPCGVISRKRFDEARSLKRRSRTKNYNKKEVLLKTQKTAD